MKKAQNVTSLRKAVTNASHIYGKVEWAPGQFVELRLVKEDLQWALRRDHSDVHPECFDFRLDTRGAVHIGRMATEVEVDTEELAEELAPLLEEHGISLSDELETFSQIFQQSLRAFAEARSAS